MEIFKKTIILVSLFAIITSVFAEKSKSVKKRTSLDMNKLRHELEVDVSAKTSKKQSSDYKASDSKSVVFLTLKLMFYIAIITGVLYFAIKYFKAKNSGNILGTKYQNKNIEILEKAFLGQNKSVNMVKVFNKILVLGVTDNNINVLSEIQDRNSVNEIIKNERSTVPNVSGKFASSVNSFLEKFSKNNNQSQKIAAQTYAAQSMEGME